RGEDFAAPNRVRRHKNGHLIHVSIIVRPIRDAEGTLIGACHLERNISEQARNEELMRVAIDAAPAAMVMTDAQGKIIFGNQLAEKLFGYAKGEMLERELAMLTPARFHERLRADFSATHEMRRVGEGLDILGLRKNGEEFPLLIGLSPINTSKGKCVLVA